jgi:alanine racemase
MAHAECGHAERKTLGVTVRPTRAEIDLEAIRHNVRAVRSAVGPAPAIMAVVKADGYGHGALPVSRAAVQAGATCLGVATPEEGADLRAGGVREPIVVLGPADPEQAALIVEHGLVAAVATSELAHSLSRAAAAAGRRVAVMAKIDTGMGRIGVAPEEAPAFVQGLLALPGVTLQGVFTHLAHADAREKTHATLQLSRLGAVLAELDRAGVSVPWISAANSATIMDLPAGHFSLVRAGIMLYGLLPSAELRRPAAVRPAMRITTRIVFLKRVRAGTTIGYGCTYTAPRETWIATLPVGYADGYARRLSNAGPVLIGGRRHTVAGRVCMDQIMVDLGPEAAAKVGEEAVLLGRQGEEEITATELAELAGTISYELLCGISPRVPRIYLNE